jgi:hypothetical protein
MSYDHLIASGFVKKLTRLSEKNPRVLWVDNASCEQLPAANLTDWLRDYKSLSNMFVTGTAGALKPYCSDLLERGNGNTDAAAVTLVIAGWQLPAPQAWQAQFGGYDQGLRKALIGSGSLNQDFHGQVHAEHITTGTVLAALPDVVKHYGWGTTSELRSLDVLIYTAKSVANGQAVQDFVPCVSCRQTLKQTLQPHKAVIGTINSLGAGIDLD